MAKTRSRLQLMNLTVPMYLNTSGKSTHHEGKMNYLTCFILFPKFIPVFFLLPCSTSQDTYLHVHAPPLQSHFIFSRIFPGQAMKHFERNIREIVSASPSASASVELYSFRRFWYKGPQTLSTTAENAVNWVHSMNQNNIGLSLDSVVSITKGKCFSSYIL